MLIYIMKDKKGKTLWEVCGEFGKRKGNIGSIYQCYDLEFQ